MVMMTIIEFRNRLAAQLKVDGKVDVFIYLKGNAKVTEVNAKKNERER